MVDGPVGGMCCSSDRSKAKLSDRQRLGWAKSDFSDAVGKTIGWMN